MRHEIKDMAKWQIKGKIGSLFLVELIVIAVTFAMSFVPLLSLLFAPAFTLATVHIYLNLARNHIKPSAKDAFGGMYNFWGAFKVFFAQGIFTALWLLLFIIPGYVKMCAYSQAFYILAENPEITARDALKRSEELMKGHKMEWFILQLSFIGWLWLSMLTFGILLIWVVPYMNATNANFYNKLTNTNGPIDAVQFN